MDFHQKLFVYYILDYFGVLFVLDTSFVLKEFKLWDQRLWKGLFCEKFCVTKVVLDYILSV